MRRLFKGAFARPMQIETVEELIDRGQRDFFVVALLEVPLVLTTSVLLFDAVLLVAARRRT